jgi:TPR repeat protein
LGKSSKKQSQARFQEFELAAKALLDTGDFAGAAEVWSTCFEETQLVRAVTMQAHAMFRHAGADEALPLFKKAASFGSTEAMDELALLYISMGDIQSAEYWALKMFHSRRIEQKEKDTDAISWIGREYSSAGLDKEAERVFLFGALLGDPNSMFELGLILLDQDFIDMGIHWLEKSSAKYNSYAMKALGDFYLKSEMRELALEWYTKASRQGNNAAFFLKEELERA